jgi:hypothetical protein
MKKEEKLKFIYRNIDELISPDYNPRKASAKEEEDIKTSIRKYGFIDPVIVNVHPDRKNIMVGGNRRVKVYKEMGGTEVPTVEVSIGDIEREKELNLRLNKNTGSWDESKYVGNFTKEMMLSVGFKESELSMYLSEFEQKIRSITNADAAYPLIPKFSEKYDAIIIVSKNEIDTHYVEQILGLDRMKSYKNQKVGKTHIIDVKHFKDQWEQK